MQIWVDADACPVVIREILFRAAERTGIALTLVANKPVRLPAGGQVRFEQVPPGLDAADKRIVELMGVGDLVITADVPLAAAAIDKGGVALNPRGELYTSENVRERLSVRNFLDELRGSGVNTGGPPALSQRERQQFANQLDRLLARWTRAAGSR
ncbi:MAG TPA: YaiI/YqxD family protein [Steroidobacteraceae bacterium]|nr:YaiI/YqxD family protein [Steroidobacteraceae bacterium]